MRATVAVGLLVALPLASGHRLVAHARPAAPLRAAAPRMQPSALDCVHVFTVDFGGSTEAKLALTQVPTEKSRSLLTLWRFMHEHEAGADPAKMGRVADELRAEAALGAGLPGVAFGAYLDGVDGEECALALMRIESESDVPGSSSEKKVLIIDRVLASPAIRKQNRPQLLSAVVESLRVIGGFDQMSVRLLTEYDV